MVGALRCSLYFLTMNEIIKTTDVVFDYKSGEDKIVHALKKVSIDVERGEFIAVLGHNGSGKSTFAKLLNALLVPNEGRVLVEGMDTSDDSKTFDIRRTAGMVFQNPDNQLVATVVDEDVAFGPENLGIPREQIIERVNAALKAVNMDKFAKRQPHMLSGGQKQRVAIAGILAIHPKVIIFDEATAMLDPQGREEVLAIMKELNSSGMTVIFITHFMEEVTDVDRIFVLNDGELLTSGTPEEVMYDEASLKKAGLATTFAAQMCLDLRKRGVKIEKNVLTIEELAEELCKLR